MPKICVLGLGYIGLPTACLLATHGHEVVGVEPRQEIRDKVNRGEVPFTEPGLHALLTAAKKSRTLSAKPEPEPAEVFIIATPTPLDDESKIANLNYIKQAATAITRILEKGNLVILESTVPPWTTEKVLLPLLETGGLKAGRDFKLAHCPERAIPGNTIYEMIHNNRIIGGFDDNTARKARDIYAAFVTGRFFLTGLRTAEIVKLLENTYRDINIALANEFALIAEETGLNAWDAIELANQHPRVNILKPGPGVGGHCLTKDPWFLAEHATGSRIISLAREINDNMPGYVLRMVKALIGAETKSRLTVLGVAYKGEVDDTRESPALKFIKLAEREGYEVRCHDPYVSHFEYPLFPLNEAAWQSDCLVLITDHSLFKELRAPEMGALMRHRNLVDTRNMLAPAEWRQAGFNVRVLGDGVHQG